MTDKRLTPAVRSWLRDTDRPPADSHRSTDRIMARLPEREKGHRWWSFSGFRHQTPTPTAADTADYQPTPIPASNGQTPTVIGRTPSMLSPVKAIAAGALVFAIGGVYLIAQPFGQQQGNVPGAESDVAAAPKWVTATVGFSGNCDFGDTANEGDVTQERGMYCQGQTWASDDPLLDGYASVAHNADSFEVDGQGYSLVTSVVEFHNDTGGWQCTNADRVASPADTLFQTSRFDGDRLSCVGSGGYEGLSAILVADWDGPSTKTVEGLIFPGGIPPMPEFPAAE